MAMSKEDQRADRIMAKEPLSERERVTYERLRMEPEDYPIADRDHRICQECGEEFLTTMESKDQEALTAFQQFADHMTKHNPSPAQWAGAHNLIRTQKDAAARNAGD